MGLSTTERIVEAAGRRIAVIAAGDGAAPPLVLCHGIGSSARSFGPVVAPLAAHRRVVAPDMPGYGGSDPLGPARPGVADFVSWLELVLDRLGIARAAIVGHSLGALLGAAFAAARPGRVSSLVLCDPAAGFGLAPGSPWPEAARSRVDDLSRLGAPAYADARAARLCAPRASAAAVEAVRREMARLTPAGLEGASSLLVEGDLGGVLDRVACPVEFVTGEEDAVVPVARVEALARRVGRTPVRLPGVGHAGYVEAPEAYAAAVLAALERADPLHPAAERRPSGSPSSGCRT